MGSSKTGSAGKGVVLPADCRIADLAEVKQAIQAALATGALGIDASAVERVDTAALQLLLAARRDANKAAATFAWNGVSDALRDAAGVLGLAQTLELPAHAPA